MKNTNQDQSSTNNIAKKLTSSILQSLADYYDSAPKHYEPPYEEDDEGACCEDGDGDDDCTNTPFCV